MYYVNNALQLVIVSLNINWFTIIVGMAYRWYTVGQVVFGHRVASACLSGLRVR